MKTLQLFILVTLMAACPFGAKSQDNIMVSPEYLGEWCTITIDLTNDPVRPGGEIVYEIPEPPEGAGLMGYTTSGEDGYFTWIEYGNIPMGGPGDPYIVKNGHTLECHFRKMALQLEITEVSTPIFDCELPVKKATLIYGSRPIAYKQCFYTVRLVVKN